MRKKIVLFTIMSILLISTCSCSRSGGEGSQEVPIKEVEDISETAEENVNISYPDISQIRSICKLATLECYYHNVAKSIKEKGAGIAHIGEKERVFWIEYNGSAKFGIDISKVKMETNGNEIEITIPRAEFFGLSDYTSIADSYISSDEGINKNPITAENQTEAIKTAEKEIEQIFKNDTTMLTRAQNNAKSLIENYINQLGESSEIDYQIIWHYEDNLIQSDSEGL